MLVHILVYDATATKASGMVTIMQEIFQTIHDGNLWGGTESVSGPGSSLDSVGEILKQLPELLKKYKIKSIIDAPCGDFHWMQKLDLDSLSYIGVDIVPQIIAENNRKYSAPKKKFLCLDIASDTLPKVDLIFCRDCLVHFSYQDIWRTLANFKQSGSLYLLTTTFADHENKEIMTGDWRHLNLEAEPFMFPQPLERIIENPPWDKALGLWSLVNLP